MKKLLLRRHYGLVVIFVLVIIFGLVLGNLRIISYNFGEGGKFIVDVKNYENDIDLFDDSLVHEISMNMENGDFETMISTYKETGKKDYFHANIIIDGVTVENAGIRLKGNLTLSQSLGTQMSMGNGMEMPGGRAGGFDRAEGFERPEGAELPEGAEQIAFTGDPFEGDFEEVEGEPPFLIKFDEFVEGQSYQGYTEIALRISSGGEKSLLTEQIAFYVHEEMGQVIPQTTYGYIQI